MRPIPLTDKCLGGHNLMIRPQPAISRALILPEPASTDAGEITDKGDINHLAVLSRRANLAKRRHAVPPATCCTQSSLRIELGSIGVSAPLLHCSTATLLLRPRKVRGGQWSSMLMCSWPSGERAIRPDATFRVGGARLLSVAAPPLLASAIAQAAPAQRCQPRPRPNEPANPLHLSSRGSAPTR